MNDYAITITTKRWNKGNEIVTDFGPYIRSAKSSGNAIAAEMKMGAWENVINIKCEVK
jgi:hypothetical protein